MARQLIIYFDESDGSGKYFSNFYGGALVESTHLEEVVVRLQECKLEQNLLGEVKWQKITEQYLSKYLAFADVTFALMREGKLKMRVMFTQNYRSLDQPTHQQTEDAYFKLYYQFVKHAFGLPFAGSKDGMTSVRINFDHLPDSSAKNAAFKGYVLGLNKFAAFRQANIAIAHDQIAEVDSKEHVVLQALDVVLGAMQFRLNDKHKEKPEGASRRGKRTIAKEKVYKHIQTQIAALYPGRHFNIGMSTGTPEGLQQRWTQPYAHWRFTPNEAVIKPEYTKSKRA
jgi:Protein of unknown function (DUF3800)